MCTEDASARLKAPSAACGLFDMEGGMQAAGKETQEFIWPAAATGHPEGSDGAADRGGF